MSFINITDLTFYYDGSMDNVLDHVTVQLDTDRSSCGLFSI